MTKDEALRMALAAFNSKYIVGSGAWRVQQDQAAKACKEALAQPERKWVGLTVEEASEIYNSKYNEYAVDLGIADFLMIYMAVEAKLKEKNT